jgi:hypothetical protein
MIDTRGLGKDEVIGGLGFELPGARTPGQRPEPAVGVASVEEKECRPGGRRKPHSPDQHCRY